MELICNYKPSPPPFSSRVEYNRILVDKQPEGERWRRGRREAGEKTLPPSPPDRFFKWSDWARVKGGGSCSQWQARGEGKLAYQNVTGWSGKDLLYPTPAAATALLYGVPSPPLLPASDLPRAKKPFFCHCGTDRPAYAAKGGRGENTRLGASSQKLAQWLFSLSRFSPASPLWK